MRGGSSNNCSGLFTTWQTLSKVQGVSKKLDPALRPADNNRENKHVVYCFNYPTQSNVTGKSVLLLITGKSS